MNKINHCKNKEQNDHAISIPGELQNFHNCISNIIKNKIISPDTEIDRRIREHAIAFHKQTITSHKTLNKKIQLKEILYYASAAVAGIAILSAIIFIFPRYHKVPNRNNNDAHNLQNVSTSFVYAEDTDNLSLDISSELESIYEEITFLGNGYNFLENNEDDEIESLLLSLQAI